MVRSCDVFVITEHFMLIPSFKWNRYGSGDYIVKIQFAIRIPLVKFPHFFHFLTHLKSGSGLENILLFVGVYDVAILVDHRLGRSCIFYAFVQKTSPNDQHFSVVGNGNVTCIGLISQIHFNYVRQVEAMVKVPPHTAGIPVHNGKVLRFRKHGVRCVIVFAVCPVGIGGKSGPVEPSPVSFRSIQVKIFGGVRNFVERTSISILVIRPPDPGIWHRAVVFGKQAHDVGIFQKFADILVFMSGTDANQPSTTVLRISLGRLPISRSDDHLVLEVNDRTRARTAGDYRITHTIAPGPALGFTNSTLKGKNTFFTRKFIDCIGNFHCGQTFEFTVSKFGFS